MGQKKTTIQTGAWSPTWGYGLGASASMAQNPTTDTKRIGTAYPNGRSSVTRNGNDSTTNVSEAVALSTKYPNNPNRNNKGTTYLSSATSATLIAQQRRAAITEPNAIAAKYPTNAPTTTTTTTAGPVTYTIGQSALGGVIAYINGGGSTGTSGLVATSANISDGALWGCPGTLISGADGTAIGTGNQNTIDIMAGCATAEIAARLCGDLVQGGYSDWYLPSKDELNQLYLNRVAIGGFASDFYWSSTESGADSAWLQSFTDGAQYLGGKTPFGFYVRAIRAF